MIDSAQAPFRYREETAGVFGLGPRSETWDWVWGAYYEGVGGGEGWAGGERGEREALVSIHYQQVSPEDDRAKILQTGRHLKVSAVVFNGFYGTQVNFWFDVSGDYPSAVSASAYVGDGMKGNEFLAWVLKGVEIGLMGVNGGVPSMGNLCFSSMAEELILVKNPTSFIANMKNSYRDIFLQ